MIIVTGAAGFIGSNLVAELNRRGYGEIVAVDNLTRGEKYRNLRGLAIADYLDRGDFLDLFEKGAFDGAPIEALFHQGACADTMEWDGQYMMRNNFTFSKRLFLRCAERGVPFLYASSASVYGKGEKGFVEGGGENEYPLNVYAYSKHLFDVWVRQRLSQTSSQVVGLRYFNVYGPQEGHKGKMASMVYQAFSQLQQEGEIRLFEGTDGFEAGEQKRDFIDVADVAKVNLFFFEHPDRSGIFNCGTGRARSFNDMARLLVAARGSGTVRYIPFPESLRSTYQSFTEADLTALRRVGYSEPFTSLEEGLARYWRCLTERGGYLV